MTAALQYVLAGERRNIRRSQEAVRTLDRFFDPSILPALDALLAGGEPSESMIRRRGRVRVRTRPNPKAAQAWAIGQRIEALRNKRGWTQLVLAERSGIARSNIARLEAGRHPPKLTTINRIARALEVPSAELLREPTFVEGEEDRQWAKDAAQEWPEP